jgi:hypothetical protein
MPNLINLIVGSIAAVLLVGSVLIASIATVNYVPVPFDLFATSTPIYRIGLYLAMMFMTIDENLIALSIPGVGRWWEALFNLLITSGLLALVVYYLPFQLRLGNEIRAALTAVLWWTSAVTFVVVNMNVKSGYVSPIMDYILLAGKAFGY